MLALGMGLLGVGCASGRIDIKDGEGKVTQAGFSLSADWVKAKDKKFDVNVIMANETNDKSIMIPLDELQCGRGTVDGNLKHTFFNTGTRYFRLQARQKKSFRMVCDLGEEATGEFRIKIPNGYDFSKRDVKDKSQILFSNLEWKYSDSK